MTPGFLTQYITGILPGKRKTSANGWTSFNAPCCIHNGESQDTRGRGGVILNPDGGVSYHCFNCNYKTSYVVGRPLSYKFRKLLLWLGASDNDVRQLVIEAIRVKEFVDITKPEQTPEPELEVSYRPRPLPEQARSFKSFITMFELNDWQINSVPEQFHKAVNYVYQRGIDMQKYDFYWTPEVEHKLSYRVIVPFTWKNEIIGYSSRAFVDGIKPKYHTEHEPNYVFNVDRQRRDSKFVLVTEGPFDAMSVDGVAVCSNECNEVQANIIDSIGKEVIVVPDFDVKEVRGRRVWSGEMLIDAALEYGWHVSFPVWRETCKDVNDAVVKYGKLFAIKAIIDSKETSRLKIELMKKRILNG